MDPVIAADGHTYERVAIADWLTNHANSLVTGAPLTSLAWTTNWSIRIFCQSWVHESLPAGGLQICSIV